MAKKDKGRLAPFVPLLRDTMKTRAWLAMSNNAKILYIAIKSHVPKDHNIAFLSQRDARREIGRGNNRMVADWFDELVHYGFIVLHKRGCLGVDGEGKAPHWRLTELGTTRATSPTGISEAPTRDYLKWDGTPFRQNTTKKRKANRTSVLISKKTRHPDELNSSLLTKKTRHFPKKTPSFRSLH